MQWFVKVISGFLTVLIIVTVLALMARLAEVRREHQTLLSRENALAEEVEAQKLVLKTKEEYVRKAVHEPEFLERIVRDRLSYVKPGESVYRFE